MKTAKSSSVPHAPRRVGTRATKSVVDFTRFLDVVYAMRKAQKKYLAAPPKSQQKQDALIEARTLERKVDWFLELEESGNLPLDS
jgi:hypothetical protein